MTGLHYSQEIKLAILNFIFQDFWHWAGTVILIGAFTNTIFSWRH